jgi:murein L,D-transpeptidase YcbB/YkuD
MFRRLLLASLVAASAAGAAVAPPLVPAPPVAGLDAPSAAGLRLLEAHVDGGYDAELPWPDFRDLRPELRRVYAARGWSFAWLTGGRPGDAAWQVAAILADAAAKGLDPADYGGEGWEARLRALEQPGAGEAERIRGDVALTVSALRYAGDLALGRVRPSPAAGLLGRGPTVEEALDLAALVDAVARAADPEEVLARAEPPWAGYRRTLALLAVERGRAAAGPLPDLPLPDGGALAPEAYPEATRLAERLRWLGDASLDAGGEPGGPWCASPLAEAVARFQERHGLDPTGYVDVPTVRALDVPASARVAQLGLALERWRWIPRRFPAMPILVNVPEFRLRAEEGGRRLSMRVVVGQAWRWGTPVFAGELTQVIFRPAWTVPLPIQQEELVPRVEADRGFVAAQGFEVLGPGDAVVPPLATPDLLEGLRTGALRLRQRAGPGSALGLVKFAFSNEGWIYLHDTPATELFARSRRDFSHGCIRVEDPVSLAEWLLRADPAWTRGAIRRAMEGERTVEVALPRPAPVVVGYFTAVAGEDGAPRYLDDIYGQDAALAAALRDEAFRRTGAPAGP